MDKSFAEVAMELSGKSAEESQSIGKVDTADDQVEDMFQEKYQTKNSPVYRAVWDHTFPSSEFFSFDFARPNWPHLENNINIDTQAQKKDENSLNKAYEDLVKSREEYKSIERC